VSKEQLDRIETKLDKIDTRLDKVDIRLAKYNAELEFHVARVTQVEDELLPIAKHVEQLRGAIKLAVWLVATTIAMLAVYLGTR